MKKIDLTAGGDGGASAFDDGKIEAAGLDDLTLIRLFVKRLGPFAQLLKEGCGFGVTVTAGQASIFGLEDVASPTDGEQRQRCLHS